MKTLNNIPVRTTNSFGVNNISLDIDIPSNLDFNDYILSDELNIKTSIKDNLTSKLGLESNKYLDSVITLDKYEEYKKPIIIRKEITNLVDKITINALKNSKANIILLFEGINAFHYLVIDTILEENADIKIFIVNLLDNNSKIFTSIKNTVFENASIETTIIELDGEVKVSNYYSEIKGNNASDTLKSIYFGKNKDIIDINYDIKNIGKNTKSDIKTVGILDDYSSKTMKMSIDFVSGSSKSSGKEIENCILLSDTAISKSVPLLLCTEEDVEGVHSVSTGKVDEDKLFYIMSRGFSYNEAIKILINGDIDSIVSNIDDEDIRNMILSRIDENINN